MKHSNWKRNVCIGLIDGVTIPLAVAAGLSQLQTTLSTIIISCVAVAIAGAITMTAGAYLEAKKYEPHAFNFHNAVLIGLSYLAGGLAIALPFVFAAEKSTGLIGSLMVASVLLPAAGYVDSRVHGAPEFIGAVRVWITGMTAAAAAFFVARLFE